MTDPAILIILDGFGCRRETRGNAIQAAKTPTLDNLFTEHPWTELHTSGEAVGLPEGQMGNSEVGHMNIGAGRVVYQMLTRIDLAIRNGEFHTNKAFLATIRAARDADRSVHLLGLVSDGGVHSSQVHLHALLALAKREQVPGDRVFIHVMTDGRDTGPRTGEGFLTELEVEMIRLGDGGPPYGRIATVGGRYWGMDRDLRWDRTKRMYDAMVKREGDHAPTALAGVRAAYAQDTTDEFIDPFVVDEVLDAGAVRDGDALLYVNFRPDRARQLTRAFSEEGFDGFDVADRPKIHMASMTRYERSFTIPFAFGKDNLDHTLGEVVSGAGLRQLRVAETEKYAHVTYFLNGGKEEVFEGEERILVQSPKHVPTYDHLPEMSAAGVTDAVVEAIDAGTFGLIVMNFANCDMVGHTGDFDATVRAVETVDGCLARILAKARAAGAHVFITADHGNAEEMVTEEGTPQTAHTTLPVPLVYVGPMAGARFHGDGVLADVAPTLLARMGLKAPSSMTGRDLLGA